MPDVFSDEEIGLTPLSDEDIGLKQLAADELKRKTFEAKIEGQQAKTLSALTDIGTEAAKGVVRAFSYIDPTGFSQGLMNQYGVEPVHVIPPEKVLPDVQTVSEFTREGLQNIGVDPNVVLPEQYRKPVEEFAAENIAALPEMAPLMTAGVAAPKPVARVFQAQMLRGVPEAAYQAATAPTPEERVKAGLSAGAGLAFPALIEHGIRERPTPIPDIPGSRLEQQRGALPAQPEAAPIERATPEQAAAQAEQMAARFEEKPATEPSILAPEKPEVSPVSVAKPEVTPLPKLSNKAIGTTWNKLVSTARGDLDELILNWNTGELSPDGSKITVPIGRDRTDNVNVSKKSFFQWLYSDDPLDPKSFDQSQQWVDLVNRTRENAGLKPKEVTPIEKPVEEPAKPAVETKAVEPLSDEQIGLTKQPWEMTKSEWRVHEQRATAADFTDEKVTEARNQEALARKALDEANSIRKSLGNTESIRKVMTDREGALQRNQARRNADKRIDEARKEFNKWASRSVGSATHEGYVKRAVESGKPVPAEVLADYPDLKPTPKPAEAPVEAVKVAEENNAPNIAKAEEQPIVGMGGAVPTEFQPQTQMQSAIKNAAVDRDRMERGEPPMMSALRKSDPELWAQAMNIVDQDAAAADKLIARHQSNPFIPTDVESMVLLHRRVDLKNEFNKAHREALLAEQEGRPEAAEAAKAVRDAMGEKLNELDAVIGKGETAQGTMAGRAFRARQLVMNQDFSMAELVTRREADLGRKLTNEEIAQLQKISDDNARLNNEYAALLEAHEKNQAAADMRKAIADSEARQKQLPYHPRILELAENYAKKWDERGAKALADLKALFGTDKPMFSGAPISPEMLDKAIIYGTSKIVRGVVDFAKWSDEMIRDIGPAFAEYTDRVWKAANEAFDKDVAEAFKKQGTATVQKVKGALKKGEFGKDTIIKKIRRKVEESKGVLPDLKYYLDRLLDYHVRQGLREESALLDAIHEDVKTVIPDITRRETREILAGYGTPVKPLPKDVVSVIKRDMHGQWQEISKIDMIRRGIFPPKLQERATMSPKQRWLRKQYEAEKRLHPEVLPTDAEGQLKSAMQAAKTRITNQITDLEHQIVTKTKIVKETKRLKPDAELQRLIAIRDEMKAVYDTVFKKPDLTDAERLDIWIERTKDRIAELTEKVKNKDFLPRKKPEPIRLNPEAIKLNFELHKVHRALLDLRLKDQLAQRGVLRKIGESLANLVRFSRAVITGGEFSAVLRQGAFTAGSHPIISAKALAPMFKSLMSEEAQFKIMEQILTRENAPLYQRAKLELTETGMRLSNMEEHYMFRVAEALRKVPGIGHLIKVTEAFQRAYTTFLNVIRADTFDALAETYGKDLQTAKDIANLINVSTGRGSVSLGKYATGLNTVLFAPRYSISRFQLLLGQPFWTAANKKMIVREYGRALAGAAVVYTLGAMAGGKIEVDPRSSDFGKIKLGNTRIDPMAGLLQVAVLLSKFASGKKKTQSGRVEPLVGPKKFGQQDIQELLSDFGMNKLAPLPSTIIKLRQGHDQVGQPYGWNNVVVDTLTPITYRDIYDTMKAQGVPEASIISVLAIFGMGVQNYQPQKTNSNKF